MAEVRDEQHTLVITYGEVVEVDVFGFGEKVSGLIHGYLDHFIGTSPTTDQLSHAIALIDDIPGVKASISLSQIDNLGHYKAVVRGEQNRKSGVISARNTPTREFHSRELSFHQEFYTAIIPGDILRFDAALVDVDTGDEA